jgi:hypothetical protein
MIQKLFHFLISYVDNEAQDKWYRLNFAKSDFDVNAEWVKKASFSNKVAKEGRSKMEFEWGEWSQDADELEVRVKVPEITKKQDIKVVIKSKALSVKWGTGSSVEGNLLESIDCDESTWTLEKTPGTQTICILLHKNQKKLWYQLFA